MKGKGNRVEYSIESIAALSRSAEVCFSADGFSDVDNCNSDLVENRRV